MQTLVARPPCKLRNSVALKGGGILECSCGPGGLPARYTRDPFSVPKTRMQEILRYSIGVDGRQESHPPVLSGCKFSTGTVPPYRLVVRPPRTFLMTSAWYNRFYQYSGEFHLAKLVNNRVQLLRLQNEGIPLRQDLGALF